VTAAGFQSYSRTGIVLEVSNDVGVDAPLTVGSAETIITVNGTAAQVQTDAPQFRLSSIQSRVVDLPLNGRNAANLVLLSGASAPTVNGNMTSTKSLWQHRYKRHRRLTEQSPSPAVRAIRSTTCSTVVTITTLSRM